MKWNLSALRSKWRYPLMLSLASMPLALLGGSMWMAGQLWLCVLFPAAYLLISWLCLLSGGKWRLPLAIVLTAAVVYAGVILLPWREAWQTLIYPLAAAVLVFFTLPMGGWPSDQEPNSSIWIVGVVIFMFAQLVLIFDAKGRFALVEEAIQGCFLAYGALYMLLLNRQSLLSGAAKGQRMPVSMRHKNRILNVGLMVLIVLVASIPALARLLERAWNLLKTAVLAVIDFLLSLFPEQEPAAGSAAGGGGGGMMELPPGGPSALALLLEKVVIVLAVILSAVLLFFALRFLWKKLRVLLKRLWDAMSRYAMAASEDYVDEVSDTRENNDDVISGRRHVLHRILQQVNEDRLTPVERIRYRYSRLLRRHSEWQPGSTARENLPDDAAVLYERARYSAETLTPEEAERFAQQSRAIEKGAAK